MRRNKRNKILKKISSDKELICKKELFTALVPNIKIGTYKGRTIIANSIFPLFNVRVSAAATEPNKLIVGVPITKLKNRISVV
tara:strand:- start:44 stop:292 length:249 start_codon:yes stop_codon:yes gene_type:complete